MLSFNDSFFSEYDNLDVSILAVDLLGVCLCLAGVEFDSEVSANDFIQQLAAPASASDNVLCSCCTNSRVCIFTFQCNICILMGKVCNFH